MKPTGTPEAALNRILDALEIELMGASDEEVLDAARSLGMDPDMKGSAAFVGLTHSEKPQLSDFFGLEYSRQPDRVGLGSPSVRALEHGDISNGESLGNVGDERNRRGKG